VRHLEGELSALARAVDWPATPDLAGPLAARLGRARRPARRRGRLAVAVALAVLAPAATVVAASSSARDAALRWLGLRGVTVERVETLPQLPGLGAGLELGRALSLADATRRAGFPIAVPAALGPPDAVRFASDGGVIRVSLLYRPRPGLPAARQTGVGLLVTELRGRTDRRLLGKLAASGTQISGLEVAGRPALALSGAPHAVAFLDDRGFARTDRLRLAATTLILDREGVLIRLEGALPVAELARIATSLSG
jgi:hypothetical protein